MYAKDRIEHPCQPRPDYVGMPSCIRLYDSLGHLVRGSLTTFGVKSFLGEASMVRHDAPNPAYAMSILIPADWQPKGAESALIRDGSSRPRYVVSIHVPPRAGKLYLFVYNGTKRAPAVEERDIAQPELDAGDDYIKTVARWHLEERGYT